MPYKNNQSFVEWKVNWQASNSTLSKELHATIRALNIIPPIKFYQNLGSLQFPINYQQLGPVISIDHRGLRILNKN